MALSDHATRHIRHAVKNTGIGDEIVSVIDAGSGTLSAAARRSLEFLLQDRSLADSMADAIDAGTALSAKEQDKLGIAISNREVAQEIADELSS